jgi:putative transposase
MTNVRRRYIPNQPVFITAVCHQRTPVLKNASSKEMLLSIMREVKSEHNFTMVAYVIMNDHFHWIIEPVDADFSKIMQSVKLRFVHRYKKQNHIKDPVRIWQNRFWDHVIRDNDDLHRHLDYIHYNPVKHGLVNGPIEYPWGSFQQHVAKGNYQKNWGCSEMPGTIIDLNFE